MSEARAKARCAVCAWPLHTHMGGTACHVPTATERQIRITPAEMAESAGCSTSSILRALNAGGLGLTSIDQQVEAEQLSQALIAAAISAYAVPTTRDTSAPRGRLPIRGVRVDGETVIVSVRGGNNSARLVCAALLELNAPASCVNDLADELPAPGPATCNYPRCSCPFDAPSDPNWCARGLPKQPRSDR